MIRIILLDLFLIFLPIGLYLVYTSTLRSIRNGGASEPVNPAPFFWLFLLGLLLMIASLALLAQFNGEKAHGSFVPPHLKDGVIERGHVE
jgi:hypothetical protein